MQWRFLPQGLLLALCLSASSRAAVFTWDGGGTTNDNWSTPANWVGDVAPPNNGSADIVFAGSTRLTPNVDANWDVLSLSFAAGASAFTIGGSPLTVESGGVTNNSTIGQTINDAVTMGAAQTWNANAGPLTFGGMANTSAFPLTISGGSTKANGAVASAGTIHVTTGSTATFNGPLTNLGSLVIDANASVGISQPYATSGSINNSGNILFGSDYTGTIGVSGTGSAFFSGVVSTGTASTASLYFLGNVTIFNEIHARLTGTAPTQYDSISVAGILNLSGTLKVALAGGFAPVAGNSFNLLHWGARNGTFSTLQLDDMGGRILWDTSHLYDSGVSGGKISVQNTFYAGDVSRNSLVDVADVSALERALCDLSFYQNGRGLTDLQLRQVADLNNDMKVNNLDLQALLNFEAQLAATGTASITAVPEPPAVVLISFGTIAIIACRTRMLAIHGGVLRFLVGLGERLV